MWTENLPPMGSVLVWHPLKCSIIDTAAFLEESAFLSWNCVHVTIEREKEIEI